MAYRDQVWQCKDLARGLEAGHFEANVYFESITLVMVDSSRQGWGACIGTILPELAQSYLNWLRENIEDCDYKPHPWAFLFGSDSLSYIEQKKAELKPKYVTLVAKVKKNLARDGRISTPDDSAESASELPPGGLI